MRAARRRLRLPLLLGAAALLLLVEGSAGSSSHSLHYFMMAVWEPGWQRPLSSSLGYVNDQLIGRYNQDTGQCAPQSPWLEDISHQDTDFWARSTGWDFPSGLIVDLMTLKNLYNQSRGIHTLQVISGCKLSRDDHTPRGFVKYGYNGRDFLRLDLATLTWTAMEAEAKPIKRKWDADRDRGKLWEHFLTDTCAEGLHTHLSYGKEALQRIVHRLHLDFLLVVCDWLRLLQQPFCACATTMYQSSKDVHSLPNFGDPVSRASFYCMDPPMVRVTRKAGLEGRETLICRLHGFYPKEIEVTWKRDGEVWRHDTFQGGVAPNSDGTYHTWLTVNIDPKDRDSYRCRVEHDGLREHLELAWEEPASKLGLLVGVLLGVVAAAILVGAGVFYIKKPQEGSYKATPTIDRASDSSISA